MGSRSTAISASPFARSRRGLSGKAPPLSGHCHALVTFVAITSARVATNIRVRRRRTAVEVSDRREAVNDRPVQLIVSDELERSRLTVFFRLILAIPLVIWLSIWGIAA